MDISSLYNISSNAIRSAYESSKAATLSPAALNNDQDVFASFLDSAVANIKETNAYLSDAENEKIRFAMGEAENTHDLTIAMQKASEAFQYTVAVRDKFLEAYKEIMNIQI
ncbi:MAG: flagellar hook-basal body complex protein FliE [Lachnospiraceae bacterium]|nr:flagellar hook-basal body complex protein FliE [Lachnospiraceae bacterium]